MNEYGDIGVKLHRGVSEAFTRYAFNLAPKNIDVPLPKSERISKRITYVDSFGPV